MRLLAIYLLALAAHGASIEGVVLDEESGNPLARTIVNLMPLPGVQTNAGAGTISVRADERGAFSLTNVRPGWYILRCTRRGFVPAEAGQLRPGRPGMPFEIAPDAQSSFFQIRMRRLGAVTGSVVDENNVGIPDWPVLIYTARKPVKRIAQVKTDDRGNFRFGELDAGSYVVRSGPDTLDDGTFLSGTFYKFGTALETAEAIPVRIGETQPDVLIRPTKGRPITLSGVFSSQTAATLTLITDIGRVALASSSGNPAPFSVAVEPGLVEFLAEGARCGGYARLFADREMQGIRIACSPLEAPVVSWVMDGPRQQFALMMRRVDLDGTGPERSLQRGPIAPGHWEMQAQCGNDYYVKSITASGRPAESSNDGWFEVDIGTSAQIAVTLSNRPASVSGLVTTGKARDRRSSLPRIVRSESAEPSHKADTGARRCAGELPIQRRCTRQLSRLKQL
jgi:hypothetical protein